MRTCVALSFITFELWLCVSCVWVFTQCCWGHIYAYVQQVKLDIKSFPSFPISILSSSLLPPLSVTTGVHWWHFKQPEDKNHTSRFSVIPMGGEKENICCYYFSGFHSSTNTASLHLNNSPAGATYLDGANTTLKDSLHVCLIQNISQPWH